MSKRSEHIKRNKERQLKQQRQRIGIAAAILVLSLVAVVWFFGGFSAPSGTDSSSTDPTAALSEEGAWDACRDVILSSLVSPISAEFQPGPDAQFIPFENGYTVVGYVDSNSRDGVPTRNDFSCRTTFNGTEWNIDDLRMME